jgi:hypothetical protein
MFLIGSVEKTVFVRASVQATSRREKAKLPMGEMDRVDRMDLMDWSTPSMPVHSVHLALAQRSAHRVRHLFCCRLATQVRRVENRVGGHTFYRAHQPISC